MRIMEGAAAAITGHNVGNPLGAEGVREEVRAALGRGERVLVAGSDETIVGEIVLHQDELTYSHAVGLSAASGPSIRVDAGAPGTRVPGTDPTSKK